MIKARTPSSRETSRQRQRGFSAAELTVCIIVLGLAFLLALKGVPAISAMRAYVLAQQIQDYRAAVVQYLVDWKALPGDDADAPRKWRRPMSLYLVNGITATFAGDGKLDGELDDPNNPLGEQYLAWQDLRFGHYIPGDAALVGQSAQPDNKFGGVFGFAAEQFGLTQVLCVTKVPGQVAAALDRRLDDGFPATGQMRGTSRWDPVGVHNHFAEPDTAPYDPEKTYIICLPDQP